MSIFEFDKDEEEKKLRKAEYEAGHEAGKLEGLEEGIIQGKKEGKKEGIEEGKKEGEKYLGVLMKYLLRDKRYADAERASEDEEFRKKLYREYKM